MIRGSLGITESSGGHMMVQGEKLSTRIFSLLGSSVGCAGMAYLNGRMPSAGQDHVVVSFGGKSAPLDLAGAIGFELLSMFDVGGYGEHAHDLARGSLDTYLSRVFTAYGSETAHTSPPKAVAAGVFDMRGARARKYRMSG
jgi:hypothetical protein